MTLEIETRVAELTAKDVRYRFISKDAHAAARHQLKEALGTGRGNAARLFSPEELRVVKRLTKIASTEAGDFERRYCTEVTVGDREKARLCINTAVAALVVAARSTHLTEAALEQQSALFGRVSMGMTAEHAAILECEREQLAEIERLEASIERRAAMAESTQHGELLERVFKRAGLDKILAEEAAAMAREKTATGQGEA